MPATLRKPAFLRIYLIPFITMLVSSMVWSISIVYAIELGANTYQVNILRSIRTFMGVLLLVPVGMLSDTLGRKAMILYSRSINFLGVLTRAFAQNVSHLYISAIVGGIAGRGFFPVLLSMIGDIAKEEEKQEAVSLLYLSSSIGLTVGPSITSLILKNNWLDLRGVYKTNAMAQILVLIYLYTQVKETTTKAKQGKPFQLAQVRKLLQHPSFRKVSTMALLYYFSRSILQTYIPLYAKTELGLPNNQIAMLSTIRNTGILVIRLLSATLFTTLPQTMFLIISLLLGGLAALIPIFYFSYHALIIAILFAGISYGAVRILGATIIAKLSSQENRGAANSLYNVAISSGDIFRTFTAPIATIYGTSSVFLLATLTAILSILPVTDMKKKGDKKSPSKTETIS